jgi:hypothetical protein
MERLVDSISPARVRRQDDWQELGVPTLVKIREAVQDGRLNEAGLLIDYLPAEGKALHDMLCDQIWGVYTQIALSLGEEAVYLLGRAAQEITTMRPIWDVLLKMSVEERVYVEFFAGLGFDNT